MLDTLIPSEKAAAAPPGEPSLLTWDTAYVTPRDRFSYFREGVCQTFCSFSPEKRQDRDIDARVEMLDLPGGVIGRVKTTPHRVVRRSSDVAKMSAEYVSLSIHLGGDVAGLLGGKEYRPRVGDIYFINVSDLIDFEIHESTSYASMAILFPKADMKGHADFKGCLSPPATALHPLRSCFHFMNERLKQASRSEMTHLFDATRSLLMASLTQDADFLEDRCGHDGTIRKGILQTIQSFVAQEVAKPALSTESAAGHFGISPRYLQKLFANDGTTFKSYVTNTRLDRIRADLLDPSLAHVSANDIAFRWGFRDVTTFHRNFKFRFGDTPRQMRAFGRSRPLDPP